jgi:hypothetical protein
MPCDSKISSGDQLLAILFLCQCSAGLLEKSLSGGLEELCLIPKKVEKAQGFLLISARAQLIRKPCLGSPGLGSHSGWDR